MKRLNIALCIWLAGGITACVEGNLSPDSGKPEPESQRVPITLQAGNITKAVVNTGDAFNPLLVCSDTEKDYRTLRWQNNATVGTDGKVAYAGYSEGEGPLYPEDFPFDIYVSGVHPQDADLKTVPNAAKYPVDGMRDVMYATEVFGNYQDGERIGANTDPLKDKPLVFVHLLTQLQFKAYRTAGADAGDFKITRITLKNVPESVTVSLADGSLTVTDVKKSLDAPVNGKVVDSGDESLPVTVGYALLPAATSYTADVETTFGTFTDIQIRPTSGKPLEEGLAHAITLKLNDKGLVVSRVTASSWLNVESGDIDL